MLRHFFLTFLFVAFSIPSWGQGMHLLMMQIGEGAVASQENGQTNLLKKASFLPADKRITVRPRSGIETMAAGYQFRFGSDTRFTVSQESIHLHEGSVMIQSRKIGNQVVLKSPEAFVHITGIGTCMLEVETNGGMKIIGVLGRLLVGFGQKNDGQELLAGELIFIKPGNLGIGDKINVNLGKVVETSFLLSGFNNSTSFQNSLSSMVKAQLDSIGKTYRAEVGDAKGVDTFEVVTFEDDNTEQKRDWGKPKQPLNEKKTSSYQVPSVDPLEELLGRSPNRINNEIDPETPLKSESRPLPGTLLRKKD